MGVWPFLLATLLSEKTFQAVDMNMSWISGHPSDISNKIVLVREMTALTYFLFSVTLDTSLALSTSFAQFASAAVMYPYAFKV